MTDAEVMVRDWIGAIQALDLDKTVSFYADDIISEDPAYQYRFTGRGEVKSMYVSVYALPDVKFEYTSSFVSGDGQWAAAKWIWSGTKGGESYSIPGVSILEIRDGKIVRETIYYNTTAAYGD